MRHLDIFTFTKYGNVRNCTSRVQIEEFSNSTNCVIVVQFWSEVLRVISLSNERAVRVQLPSLIITVTISSNVIGT